MEGQRLGFDSYSQLNLLWLLWTGSGKNIVYGGEVAGALAIPLHVFTLSPRAAVTC